MSVEVLGWVLRNSEARLSDRLVLIALADHAHADGSLAFPSVPTIAGMARISERQVQVSLRSLEKAGRIRGVGESKYETTIYEIRMSEPKPDSSPGADSSGVQNTVQTEPDSAPNPLGNPSLSSSTAPLFTTTENDNGNDPHPRSAVVARTRGTVEDLFNYWRERCGHPKAKLTSGRRSKVEARLKEGYTPQEVRTAIDGMAVNGFVNDEGVKYDDLALICRNGENVEKNIARAKAKPGLSKNERRRQAQSAEFLATFGTIDGTAEAITTEDA